MPANSRFYRFFFSLLYHQLAWGYDLVAGFVSLGRWGAWVNSVTPFLKGPRILELGHCPGHLQKSLLALNLLPFGLDESPQMGRMAKKNLFRSGYAQTSLVRGLGQALPFRPESFDSIVATFPTEYIFEGRTIAETKRILAAGGRIVFLPVAWITGGSLPDRFGAWLFRITGQAPDNFEQSALSLFIRPFQNEGFQVQTEILEVKSSRVLIFVAIKLPPA